MKRTAAILLAAVLLLLPLCCVHAETVFSYTRDAYGLRVSSIDLITSLNGKYTVLRQTRTTGRIVGSTQIRYEYDFEQEKPDFIGRFEEDAPVALVTVDGFSAQLAAIQDPDLVVVTVDGLPIAVPENDAYRDDVGWCNANKDGLYCVVFPIQLTKTGGVATYTVCVQALVDGVRVTETVPITVTLCNTHEYKDERTLRIAALDGQNVDAYLLGDRIYLDHPATATGASAVRITFADETGAPFDTVAWAAQTTCAHPDQSAVLYLEEECRLRQSQAEYCLDAADDAERSRKVTFAVETQNALYRTQAFTIVQRFDVPVLDPKGIYFAQNEYTLPVGGTLQPIVLSVATDEPVRTTTAGRLELLPALGTDAQILDLVDGSNVIAVKPGTACIIARYTLGDRVYTASSMRITVCEQAQHMTVLCRALNVRQAPSVTAPRIGMLHRGDAVEVVSIQDGWALTAQGQYVCAQYLTR